MRRLFFALLLAPTPVLAQTLSPLSPEANSRLPQCGPTMDGQAMCRFGVIYECAFIDPNGMERRTGWRWKPDLLRGCDSPPANAEAPYDSQRGLPPGLTLAPSVNEYNLQPGQSGVPMIRGSEPVQRRY